MTAEPIAARPKNVALAMSRLATLRSRRLWLVLLFVGFAVQVAWRLHLSLPLTGPIAQPDEDGYLLGARVLAGGPEATLPAASIMRPMGYPLLLAPVYLFVREPVKVYLGVHIVNAVLMAANFPLLYALGRRLFNTSRVRTAVAAFVLALLPSLVYFGDFALTDVLLPGLLMVLLLAVHEMLTGNRRLVAGVVAGVVAGYAANTHVRGLVMLIALGGLVGVALWRRWITWSVAAATAAGGVVVYLIGYVINSWLRRQLFPDGGPFHVEGRVIGRLTTLHGAFRVLADGFGQVWYLSTSTYGLAGLGLAASLVMLVRREGALPTRVVLGMAMAMNLGIAFATATGIPDEHRVNNHIYGRYVALFAGLWSLVAIVSLVRATRRRSVVIITAAALIEIGALGLVWLHAHGLIRHEAFVSFDAPELAFLSDDYLHMHFLWVTGLSIVFMVVFALLFSGWRTTRSWGRTVDAGRRWSAVAGLGGLLMLNLVAMYAINNGISVAWGIAAYHPGPAQLVRDAHVQPGSSIAEASNVPWTVNQRHQREVFWERLVPFNPLGSPPGTPAFVVALAGTNRRVDWAGAKYGYEIDLVCHEGKNLTWAVWEREPGTPNAV